jgi:tetratricopeptide (TPR) repeat protein
MRLVFFGNCQLHMLQRIYSHFVVPHVGGAAVHVQANVALRPEHARAIATADVLVTQITQMAPGTDISHIETKARRMRVPVAGAMFLWPFAGTRHPDHLKRYPGYGPFTAEMCDGWIVNRLRSGGSATEIVAEYLALDVARAGHLERRLEMSLETQAMLEAGTGYAFAPLIEAHYRSEQLFKTPYHPQARLARTMAEIFLAELGAPAAAQDNVRQYLTHNFMVPTEVPIHPGVAAHFGLQWADAATKYRFYSEDMLTFEQWALRVARCEAYPAVNDAVNAVMGGAADGAAKLAAARGLLPASPLVWHAEAVLHTRAGRFDEALVLLRRVAAVAPAMMRLDADLFECLYGLGRWDEAEAALRAELMARPYQFALQAKLAAFLAELGRWEDAVGAAEIALALAPDRGAVRKLAESIRQGRLGETKPSPPDPPALF